MVKKSFIIRLRNMEFVSRRYRIFVEHLGIVAIDLQQVSLN